MTTYTFTTFSDGDPILADEVNDNFQYCLADTTTKVNAIESAISSGYVNTTTTQTIAGSKAFTDASSLAAGTLITKQDADKAGGLLSFQKGANDPLSGNPFIDLYNGRIRVAGPVSGTDTAILQVDIANNRVLASPSATANSVVTTVSASAATNGYVEFGNGWILQKGFIADSGFSSNKKTVTLPKAFTTQTYVVIPVQVSSGNSTSNIAITARGYTAFTIYANNGEREDGILWFAFGQ